MTVMTGTTHEESVSALADLYFDEQATRNSRRMDRIFAVLMVIQWLAAMAVTSWLSPWVYAGATRSLHPHILQALFGGALLTAFPLAMVWLCPGQVITRHVVAATQMLWSALLIHVSGGRIETHFHIFGSLAFIAFYRDWRLLVTATLVIAADHFLRGTLAPLSVYGVVNPEWWRFLEHAGWVVFEDVVLVMSCLDGVRDLRESTKLRAEAEVLSATLERRVDERTEELSRTNGQLTVSLEQQKQTQQQLIQASRKAGMADVATAVLHNVGNVLNSVNVSAGVIGDTVRRSKSSGVAKLATLVAQKDLATLLESHPKGKQIPPYLTQVSEAIAREQVSLLNELDGLQKHVEHIKVIVNTQQMHAKGGRGLSEDVAIADLVEEALTVNSLHRPIPGLRLVRDLQEVPVVRADRHQVFQIVVNLVANARHAAKGNGREEGTITLRLRHLGERIHLDVQDDGYGIASENLTRIFNHGFTTKVDGHGFGLHSSANAAREMGGQLTCASEGPGRGATFTLELPVQAARKAA